MYLIMKVVCDRRANPDATYTVYHDRTPITVVNDWMGWFKENIPTYNFEVWEAQSMLGQKNGDFQYIATISPRKAE